MRWKPNKVWFAVLICALVPAALLAYRWYKRLPWIDLAARLHSERGAINCGHVFTPDYAAARSAVACAQSAHSQRRAFRVIFTVTGVDERVSNAVIGDSDGNATEILYATGTVVDADRLMRHACSSPAQLLVESGGAYPIARIHCAPWPTATPETNFLLW